MEELWNSIESRIPEGWGVYLLYQPAKGPEKSYVLQIYKQGTTAGTRRVYARTPREALEEMERQLLLNRLIPLPV